MKTRGEHIAEAIRDHLMTNGLKKTSLTGVIVAELADRVLAHLEKLDKKKRRLATEEDWIKELESEPHLAGINVRKELAACQFWCKNNTAICTRKRFVNWLNRAEKSVVVSPGGAKPRAQREAESGPIGWLAKLNDLFSDSVYAKGGTFEIEKETDHEWGKLDPEIKSKIRGEIR